MSWEKWNNDKSYEGDYTMNTPVPCPMLHDSKEITLWWVEMNEIRFPMINHPDIIKPKVGQKHASTHHHFCHYYDVMCQTIAKANRKGKCEISKWGKNSYISYFCTCLACYSTLHSPCVLVDSCGIPGMLEFHSNFHQFKLQFLYNSCYFQTNCSVNGS